MHFLAHAMRGDQRPDLAEVFGELSRKFDGAYNLAFLNAMGEMIVLRDPLGLRPLCYATDGGVFAAASESVALQNLGFRDIKSLPPGHLIHVRPGACAVHRFAEARSRPTASSSGSTSPTWPAPSTTAASTCPAPHWARNSPSWNGR